MFYKNDKLINRFGFTRHKYRYDFFHQMQKKRLIHEMVSSVHEMNLYTHEINDGL